MQVSEIGSMFQSWDVHKSRDKVERREGQLRICGATLLYESDVRNRRSFKKSAVLEW